MAYILVETEQDLDFYGRGTPNVNDITKSINLLKGVKSADQECNSLISVINKLKDCIEHCQAQIQSMEKIAGIMKDNKDADRKHTTS